jgi:hypothetical protein
MVPHPETGELLAYQRASTFAKTLDDKEGLIPWKAWMALRGAERDHALKQQALHAAATPRGVIDALAELGGAGEKRDRGSDRHQLLAMALSGAPMPQMPAQARAELDAVLRLVESLGSVVSLEAPNVCDEYGTTGSCDLVLQAADGSTVVADFKTGARVDRLSHSIQLIAYARARYWDFGTESRLGLVAPTRPRLVVISAPQDGSQPQAVDLDVEKAKQWAALAAAVREARREAARKIRESA